MFVFRIGADITGRHYDMPTALAASAVLTVGIHPLYLYDGGFWLSFGAVFAVCTVIPVLENEMRCKSLCAGLGINVLLWPAIHLPCIKKAWRRKNMSGAQGKRWQG